MKAVLVILGMLLLVLLAGRLHQMKRKRRRGKAGALLLGEEERTLLRERVPLYARMPEVMRRRLGGVAPPGAPMARPGGADRRS